MDPQDDLQLMSISRTSQKFESTRDPIKEAKTKTKSNLKPTEPERKGQFLKVIAATTNTTRTPLRVDTGSGNRGNWIKVEGNNQQEEKNNDDDHTQDVDHESFVSVTLEQFQRHGGAQTVLKRKAAALRHLTQIEARHTYDHSNKKLARTFTDTLPTKILKAQRLRAKTSIRRKRVNFTDDAEMLEYLEYDQYNFWDFDEFQQYGLGVGFYFDMLRQLGLMMLVMLLCSMPALVMSFNWNGISAFFLSNWALEKFTLGNFGDYSVWITDEDASSVQNAQIWGGTVSRFGAVLTISIMDAVGTTFCVLYTVHLIRKYKQSRDTFKRDVVSVSHYTVLVENLPEDFADRVALAKFLEQRYGPVAEIHLTYNDPAIFELYIERGTLREQRDVAQENNNKFLMHELTMHILAIDDQLKNEEVNKDTLVAWVVFEEQQSKAKCLQDATDLNATTANQGTMTGPPTNGEASLFNSEVKSGDLKSRSILPLSPSKPPAPLSTARGEHNNPWMSMTMTVNKDDLPPSSMFSKMFSMRKTKPAVSGDHRLLFQGKKLKVTAAHQPSNIFFENFRYTRKEKNARRGATAAFTIVIIILSTVAVYFSSRGRANLTQYSTDCRPISTNQAEQVMGKFNTTCYCQQLGFSQMMSQNVVDCAANFNAELERQSFGSLLVFSIIVVNFFLLFVSSKLSAFEKHLSISIKEESMAKKLFWGLFMNTAIILMLVNSNFSNKTDSKVINYLFGGEYNDFIAAWYTEVAVTITLTMIVNIGNPQLLPLLQIPYNWWKRRRASPALSQHELNELYRGPRFEPAERHAVALTTVFTTFMYGGAIPFLYLLAFCAFAFTYFCDKAAFLFLYRIPNRYDESLNRFIFRYIPWAFVLHLCMSIWVYSSPTFYGAHLKTPIDFALENTTSSISLWDRLAQPQVLPVLIVLIPTLLCCIAREFIGKFKKPDSPVEQLTQDLTFRPYSVVKEMGIKFESYGLEWSKYYQPAFHRTTSGRQLAPDLPLSELRQELIPLPMRKKLEEVTGLLSFGKVQNQVLNTEHQSFTDDAQEIQEEETELVQLQSGKQQLDYSPSGGGALSAVTTPNSTSMSMNVISVNRTKQEDSVLWELWSDDKKQTK